MALQKLLVANRGEIALRIMRGADELGLPTVAVYAEDDADAAHRNAASEAVALDGRGVGPYLDLARLLSIATEHGCDGLHPGYGFLAESSELARRCEAAGLVFVGPTAAAMEELGDKISARALARRLGLPVMVGSDGPVTVAQAEAFFESLDAGAAMMIKAAAGGGGRGMRLVRTVEEVPEAMARCRSEAGASFGDDTVFVERFMLQARHIEVQIVADGEGSVVHLGERECSVQRRHQKLIEIAPSPWLDPELRDRLTRAAVELALAARYRSLGTIEFLVDALPSAPSSTEHGFAFIEANTRIQVEHTITEEVTGVDLVQTQLRLAGGERLADVGLGDGLTPSARGYAVQARVNTERLGPDGTIAPSGGSLTVWDPSTRPGVRIDSAARVGQVTNPSFDSLLAKVIVQSGSASFADARRKMSLALGELRIGGVETNLGLLRAIVDHADFSVGTITTRWLDDHLGELVSTADGIEQAEQPRSTSDGARAGAQVDERDPLAILDFFRQGEGTRSAVDSTPVEGSRPAADIVGPADTVALLAPIQGTVVEITVTPGETVGLGGGVVVLESMKMEHVVSAEVGGVVRMITVSVGDIVYEGHPLAFVEAREVDAAKSTSKEVQDLDEIRPDLRAFLDRRALTFDDSRPDATERRRQKGKRTIRENIGDLVDADSFQEYGTLAVARRRSTMPLHELRLRSPADGLVTGIGKINGDRFDASTASSMVIAYDEAVWAGSQSGLNHIKFDRAVRVADEFSLPVIFFGEGVGGRSGDTDLVNVGHGSGAQTLTYEVWPKLSGKVPLIGITAGWCFAGNASILGCCDIIIATPDAMIGMGGPAVIAGGGLGNFLPAEIGPMADQVPNGVVDLLVADEADAVATAKKYLSYFQGRVDDWTCADQRELRHAIPENRMRAYDVRVVIELMADTGSVLELRPEFGPGVITAFARIEGRPIGIVANNNAYLGGAVDSPASDKLCRFAQICDSFNIPLISLIDTPGMMVGPEVERTALVRHCNNIFVTLTNARCARMSIVLRKAYGLAAQAMTMGCTRTGMFTVAWPTGEFGGMNLEASVLLGHRHRLAEIDDLDERAAAYQKLVDEAYARGAALNVASTFEIDDVIDPADTRARIVNALDAVPRADSEPLRRGRRAYISTW